MGNMAIGKIPAGIQGLQLFVRDKAGEIVTEDAEWWIVNGQIVTIFIFCFDL